MRGHRARTRLALAGLLVAVGAALAAGQDASRSEPPPRFGTKVRIIEHLGLGDFASGDPASSFITTGPSGHLGIFTSNPPGFWWATARLPAGALLTYLELDYCDSSPIQDVSLTVEDCNYLGADCHVLKSLFSSDGASECGLVSADLEASGYTMDPFHRELVVLAQMDSNTVSTQLLGAYLGYRLQISPAPLTATFLDVPTNHPYFRAIEAMAASGITGGCGGGNYCPSQNVTRAEMAAFLARALGLHFPN